MKKQKKWVGDDPSIEQHGVDLTGWRIKPMIWRIIPSAGESNHKDFTNSRWGIILRSTVRTSDISWFSLLLLLQNGSQRDTRIGFAQKTAMKKVISSIFAANKCCQSTAGYVSFETD